MQLKSTLFCVLAAMAVLAHPGGDHRNEHEIIGRRAFFQSNKASLDHCADKLVENGIVERAVHRRLALRSRLAKREITDDDPLTISHEHDGNSLSTPPSDLFDPLRSKGCVLSPEVTEGPYYVEGEYVRSDVREDQPGVDLHLDLQAIDTATCAPVAGVYVEIWHANATGVYGGYGRADDGGNEYRTWLRGLQATDGDGVVAFATKFPGFYGGRAPHVHVMTHVADARARANGTVADDRCTHNGQVFFDQALVDAVYALAPYRDNAQPFVRNALDGYLRQEEAHGADPFVHYDLLGVPGDVGAGLLAWMPFGINLSNYREIYVADSFHPPRG